MIKPLFVYLLPNEEAEVCIQGTLIKGKIEDINYNGVIIDNYYIPYKNIDYIKTKYKDMFDKIPFNFWKSYPVMVDEKVEVITTCGKIVGKVTGSDTDFEGRTKYFSIDNIYIIDISKVLALKVIKDD